MEKISSALLGWASILEPSTREQAMTTATMPFIHPHVALMPDAHLGLGATVGSVIPTLGAIMPAAVGVDIGCGMIAVRTQLMRDDLPRNAGAVRQAIERAVPTSAGAYNTAVTRAHTERRIAELEQQAARAEFDPSTYAANWRMQLGTLGSGNHFIELTVDELDRVWLFLHSGSRGVGNKIAQRHIKVAQELCAQWWISLPHKDSPTLRRARRSSGPTFARCGGLRPSRCRTATR
jgi:tRNA-splicing ligase RtcB